MDKDKFFERFPVSVSLGYGCYVDDCEHETCVWDTGVLDDCSYAAAGVKKEDCPEWREETTPAYYTTEEVWGWLKSNNTQ